MNRKYVGAGVEAAKYYSVGLVINVVGYAAFLLLVTLGIGVKAGFTIVFLIATTVSFWANRNYVFRSNNDISAGYALHLLNSAMAYALNLLMLWIFVDLLRVPVAYVQLGAAVFTSLILFISNKLFVHRQAY